MDHATTVGVGHRLTDLLEDSQELPPVGDRFGPICQQLPERCAFHQFHAEERPLVGELAQLIHWHNPRVLQLAPDLGFLDEPLDDLRFVLMLIQQHLDRQVTTQIGVAALEDGSHAAARDFAVKLVAIVGLVIRHFEGLRPHDRFVALLDIP